MTRFLMMLIVLLVITICIAALIGQLPVFALNGLIDLGNYLETLSVDVLL